MDIPSKGSLRRSISRSPLAVTPGFESRLATRGAAFRRAPPRRESPFNALTIRAVATSSEWYTRHGAKQANRCVLDNAMPPGGLEPPTHGLGSGCFLA
jgi:hypothetical protein